MCEFGTNPYQTSFEEYWCDALKDDWFNFGTDMELGDNVWAQGEPYYCGEGPLLYAGAILATDYSHVCPDAGLVAVNGGTYLPGAVYRCCKMLINCFDDGAPEPPTECPVIPTGEY
jgi:hypothetical protein